MTDAPSAPHIGSGVLPVLALACGAVLPCAAMAEAYTLPDDGNSVVGQLGEVKASSEETLLDVARRHGLGYEDIVRANAAVDAWVPEDGAGVVLATQFVLPDTVRRGLVLNLAEYRLYYYRPDGGGSDSAPVVVTFPMSIGRMDWETPLGLAHITQKAKNPSWYPPESVRKEHADDGDPLPAVVPPGPQNPLGRHALRLSRPGYLIHGTNKAAGVGMRVTHGCLRLFPEDIEALFAEVAVGTEVRIIDQPVKAGWLDDTLLLEVHPSLESDAAGDEAAEAPGDEPPATANTAAPSVDAETTAHGLTEVTRAIVNATEERRADIDWALAEQVFNRAEGVPVVVGRSLSESPDLWTKKRRD